TSLVPAGPYSDTSLGPLVCQTDRGGSIDPNAVVDADGSAWLVWKSEGTLAGEPTRVWIQRLTDDGLGLVGGPADLLHRDQGWEWPVIENPTMARVGGTWYLFYSGNLWSTPGYAMGYAVCSSVTGPCWKPQDGPVLGTNGGEVGPGAGSVFTDNDGTLWMAYHAWTAPRVGYDQGGVRSLRIAYLGFFSGRPVIGPPG